MINHNNKACFSLRLRNMLKAPTLSVLALCSVFFTLNVNAAYVEPSGRANLPSENVSAGSGNDTNRLQGAINRASNKSKGGRVIIKAGTYELNNVQLKSNVHIEIEKGVTLKPYSGASGTVNLFVAGKARGTELKNISVRGKGGRFKIVYPSSHKNATRAFLVGNVNNLLIRDINITENYTKFSAISFILQDGATGDYNRAKNVTVEGVSLRKSLYGYGLIQANSGQDMLFRNLKSTDAGVTVRIETDLEINNEKNIGIDNIRAANITCIDGHAAVFMQPHSIRNGSVKIDRVTANQCGVGVYIQKNVNRFPGLPDGSFANDSYVRNIKVSYGSSTPVSYAKVKYMPRSLRSQVKAVPNGFYDVYRRGPSAAAVVNRLSNQVTINNSNVSHSGTNVSSYSKIVTNTL